MPTRPKRFATLALALPLLAGAMCLRATENPPVPAFSEQVEVNVVNLEVFATDRNGQPVTDLKPEDFTVLEDGRPVPVTNFFVAEKELREGPAATVSAAP